MTRPSHRKEISREIQKSSKPIVFVEGDYDIKYLSKAAQLLNKVSILESVQLKDGDGFGNLDKIWKSYNNSMSEVVPNKIILLYDCDTRKQDANKNLIYKCVIPPIQDNPIQIGIENLFPEHTINRVEREKPQYIDITQASSTRIRGEQIAIPESRSVNKDEKGNMCNWLCEYGTADDFLNFETAFDIIEEVLANS